MTTPDTAALQSSAAFQDVSAPVGGRLPYLAVCAAVLCWGIGPLLVRAISASAITIAFYRLWIAAPATLLVAYLARTPLTLPVFRRAVPGGVMFAASIVTGFASFQQTSVANATLIASLTPVIVLLIAGRMFGERVTKHSLVFAALSVAGVIFVVIGAGGGSGASLQGDLLAVADLVTFTAYFVEIKRQRTAGVPAASLLAGVVLVAALTVTPVALITSRDLGAIGGWDWFWVVGMVLVPGLGGHGLMAWAHRHVDVTISSLLTLANPVIATVGAWLVYDQSLTAVQVFGAALVIGGLVGVVAAAPRPAAEVAIDTT